MEKSAGSCFEVGVGNVVVVVVAGGGRCSGVVGARTLLDAAVASGVGGSTTVASENSAVECIDEYVGSEVEFEGCVDFASELPTTTLLLSKMSSPCVVRDFSGCVEEVARLVDESLELLLVDVIVVVMAEDLLK